MTITSRDVAAETDSSNEPPPESPDNTLDPGQGRRGRLLIAPTAAALTIVIVYPVLRAVYVSFQKDPTLDPQSGLFVTGGFAGIDNYTHWILQRCGDVACPPGNNAESFYSVVWITVMFTVITVILETILGMWFALIMNKNIKGRGLLRAAILIPWAIPTAVTAKLWYFIFAYDGIANSLLHVKILWTGDQWPARLAIIVADTWKTTPFMALLILAGLQLISAEVYESARFRSRQVEVV
ncbi:MAG: sugar ABC transporter permease, partial [Nocardioidaceae bacterium]